MTWRRVAVYWALALAVAAELALTLHARESSTQSAAPVAAPIVDAAPASVDALKTETRSGTLELRKQAGRWRVESPPGVTVSSDLVAAFIDTLTTIPPIEILADAPDRLPSYGLEPPLATVELAAGGRELATITLGQRNPTRTAVYARRSDEPRVYLLGLNAQYYLELLYEQAAATAAAAGERHG